MLKKELTDRQAITLMLTTAAIVGGKALVPTTVEECSVLADQILNLEKPT